MTRNILIDSAEELIDFKEYKIDSEYMYLFIKPNDNLGDVTILRKENLSTAEKEYSTPTYIEGFPSLKYKNYAILPLSGIDLHKLKKTIREYPNNKVDLTIGYIFKAVNFEGVSQQKIQEKSSEAYKTIQKLLCEDESKRTNYCFIYMDCRFGEVNSYMKLKIGFNLEEWFYKCEINKWRITGNSHDKYGDDCTENMQFCKIKKLYQTSDLLKFISIKNGNVINKLVTNAEEVILRDLEISTYYHRNLGQASIKTDNVCINFDLKIAKEIDNRSSIGYLNTFHYLRKLNSMKSEIAVIDRYIHFYSSSRVIRSKNSNFIYRMYYKLNIKRLLFRFNQGYYIIHIPFCCFILSAILIFGLLSSLPEVEGKQLYYLFFPYDLFKNVLLAHFSFRFVDISLVKILIISLELPFIYSAVSLGIAIKRILGFKIKE